MRGLCAVVGGRSVPARRAVVMFDCAAWQCAGVRAYAAIRPSRIWCVHTARQQTSRPTPPAPALAEPWRSSRRTSDDLRCSPSGSYCGTAHPPRTNGMWRRVSTLVSVRRSCPAIAVTGSITGTGSIIGNRLAVVTRHARVCGVCGLGAWDRVWSGDGLVIRRREGAAVAQYHRADRC